MLNFRIIRSLALVILVCFTLSNVAGVSWGVDQEGLGSPSCENEVNVENNDAPSVSLQSDQASVIQEGNNDKEKEEKIVRAEIEKTIGITVVVLSGVLLITAGENIMLWTSGLFGVMGAFVLLADSSRIFSEENK